MEKLIGTGWYPDSPKADEDKITKAIIGEGGKEIAVDYNYHGQKLDIRLTSEDGVAFKGEYGKFGSKIGSCGFILYRNLAGGYFLLGDYNSDVDGGGKWYIKLNPQGEQERK